MKLPDMKYAERTSKGNQTKFGGLNHTMGAGDGEIWDMRNLTSDHAPVLSTRTKRYLYKRLTNPGGIFSWDKMCWIEDGYLYYDGNRISHDLGLGKKRFVGINKTIVVMPNKFFFNTETEETGFLGADWGSDAGVIFGNGMLFGEPASANMIRCEGVVWSNWFREGDAITINSCIIHPENNKTVIILEIDGDKMYFSEYSFTLEDGADYTETGTVNITRETPEMDFMCENENRMWGCDGHTIYASKLGDPLNWNVFDGLSSDSWFVETGTPGTFVGGIAYKSFAILFMEDRIYKVYGSVPSNFQAVDSATQGLEKGSGMSLTVAGETIFYLSGKGVMAYSGGIPQPVGEELGMERFKNAAAGSDGQKYYISMQGEDGRWRLYVYDTRKGMWHIEDDTHFTHFARHEGNLYGLTEDGEIWILGSPTNVPEDAQEEDEIEWMVEFADFTENEPNRKEIRKLNIRLELEECATIEAYIQYDSDGIWRNIASTIAEGPKRSHLLSLVPRRCDHFRLKLEGTGGCRIYGIAREYRVSTPLKSGRN